MEDFVFVDEHAYGGHGYDNDNDGDYGDDDDDDDDYDVDVDVVGDVGYGHAGDDVDDVVV